MANADILKIEENLLHFSIFDFPSGEGLKSRGQLIERKIEALEKLAGKVSNRRSRRWMNDRLLIELVPRLRVEEIRGLFAPPPWGESTPLSAFCMTNVAEWDAFRSIDMDKEARLIGALEKAPSSIKESVEKDKLVVLNAWHRVDCRSREAFRHKLLSELVENYEEQIQAFIKDGNDEDVLKLHVQNPFHRLLLHGVCEYYDLISATAAAENSNRLKVTQIRKKRSSKKEALPGISLSEFLKISKDGFLME
ncbi:R3H domain-containing protein 4-like [Phalaenopsis equestris]|uniref:R3H domain-containing protein 4-like n=1 Tax=Phalaenopsis equestris TaxID=78828 RepID=UPI0009E3FA95|nr:R3H domain-containing protein 4-like [Phalaenopsis equestris]XP_020596002.1 R3H domain-containing protein 4-like [Phalaenopsis equestris]